MSARVRGHHGSSWGRAVPSMGDRRRWPGGCGDARRRRRHSGSSSGAVPPPPSAPVDRHPRHHPKALTLGAHLPGEARIGLRAGGDQVGERHHPAYKRRGVVGWPRRRRPHRRWRWAPWPRALYGRWQQPLPPRPRPPPTRPRWRGVPAPAEARPPRLAHRRQGGGAALARHAKAAARAPPHQPHHPFRRGNAAATTAAAAATVDTVAAANDIAAPAVAAPAVAVVAAASAARGAAGEGTAGLRSMRLTSFASTSAAAAAAIAAAAAATMAAAVQVAGAGVTRRPGRRPDAHPGWWRCLWGRSSSLRSRAAAVRDAQDTDSHGRVCPGGKSGLRSRCSTSTDGGASQWAERGVGRG